jgi:uncharacterized protein YecE (DUF72 family)
VTQILAGTSGFAYDEWKGPLYPGDAQPKDYLRLYAGVLPTVEVNNTFYQVPRRDVVEAWAASVPETFRFAIKASRRITHFGKLRDPDDGVGYLSRRMDALGDKLGTVLYQCPPSLRKDAVLLRDFVARLPDGQRAAMELRNPSWLDEESLDILRERDVALVVADLDEDDRRKKRLVLPERFATATHGYLRLRADDYTDDELRAWADKIRAQAWTVAFVYFKDEVAAAAPRLAKRVLDLVGAPST